MAWRPISEIAAARDGRRILVCLKQTGSRSLGRVRIVRWKPNQPGSVYSGVWHGDVAGHYFHDPDFIGWDELPAPIDTPPSE